MKISKPFWLTDTYDHDVVVAEAFDDYDGPNGLALVRAWPSGITDPGWGLRGKDGGDGFMPRYLRGEFNARRVVHGYNRDRWAFAFIMRSVQMICIDIDGKNDGFSGAKKLGVLPATLAETSKSGNGYHLFYLAPENWDPVKGFGSLSDRIGIEQGVDIRATGCVYHHKTQRWNRRDIVELPEHLYELLAHREQRIAEQSERINRVLEVNDDMEVLMLHDEILSNLAKDIPDGKRNVTLFAIGNQMRQAEIPNWEIKLRVRAAEVDLPDDEADKLVANIERYGSPVEATS